MPGIVKEGLKNHPRLIELKEIDMSMHKKTDPAYKTTALELYFDTLESKYYRILKSLPDWNRTLDAIIRHFTKHKLHHMLIDVYLDEKMNPEALRHVINSATPSTLSGYHDKLAHLYPKEYFEAYRIHIVKFASSNTGRDHYKRVKSYLKKIRTIPKHKAEFKALVDEIREQNSTKPAFLDELKNV